MVLLLVFGLMIPSHVINLFALAGSIFRLGECLQCWKLVTCVTFSREFSDGNDPSEPPSADNAKLNRTALLN